MAEHLRQKLQEKLYRQFGEFLTICSLSQNSNGKLESLECEVKDEEHHRIFITCETNNKFVVFTTSDAAKMACQDEAFAEWLDAVMGFGISGRCSSLSALFQFMYERRTRDSSSSFVPALMEASMEQAIVKASEAADAHRPHQAIDVISEALRLHSISLRPGMTFSDFPIDVDLNELEAALFIRCCCYANAGMFTLALADAEIYLQLFIESCVQQQGPSNRMAEILFWRGFSLEGLLRPREALDSYMASLEADPGHSRAQEQFHVLFETISRSQVLDAAQVSPASSQRRGGSRPRRDRGQSHTNESVADSHTSGTTASRRSSRSTTPTSSGSERDE
jgi:hypothetical protein